MPQNRGNDTKYKPNKKKGQVSADLIGPRQMIAPENLPRETVVAGPAMAPASNKIPGEYTSLVPGPSYGKPYIMPEDQRVVEVDGPGFFENDGMGEQILDGIGNAATDAYEWGKGAVNSIGGFFSSLFGGDEEEAKQVVKKKMAQKIAQKQGLREAPQVKIENGSVRPVFPAPAIDPTQARTIDRLPPK